MAVVFAPDGKTFATAQRGEDVQIRDTATGKVTRNLWAMSAMFPAIAFDGEGKRLFGTCATTDFQVWNLDPEEPEPPSYFTRERVLSALAVSPTGRLMATAGSWEIGIREDETKAVRWKLKGHSDGVRSLAFSRDGKRLASGSEDKSVRVWNVAEMKQELVFTDHTDTVWSVAFSPNGKWLASASEDMTVRLRPIPSGNEGKASQ